MMEVRWIVKTTPEVKSHVLAACVQLAVRSDVSAQVAARMIAEVFDIKLKEKESE